MLQWGPIGNESSLLLLFSQNNSNEQFELSEIVVEINVATELPNGQKGTLRLYHHKNTFSTPLHMSYHCTKPQTLNLVADDKSSNSTIVAWAHVSHVQLEAFHKQKNTQFSVAKDCDAIDTPGKHEIRLKVNETEMTPSKSPTYHTYFESNDCCVSVHFQISSRLPLVVH